MKRQTKYLAVLSIVVFLLLTSLGTASAQQWTTPETIESALELSEYQMHVLDIYSMPPMVAGAAIADRNQLAQNQARWADSIGAMPAPQTMPWYVECDEIKDCNQLAQYKAHMMDVIALGRGY